MTIPASSVAEYLDNIPDSQKDIVNIILKAIRKNIPKGFEECINYGMIGWVVPHSLYSPGYHCDPKLPLPFLSLAAQKNSVNVYHMGIYADTELFDWFIGTYETLGLKKLDIGKSCMRFKKTEDVPLELLSELVSKINPSQWIKLYEKAFRSSKKV